MLFGPAGPCVARQGRVRRRTTLGTSADAQALHADVILLYTGRVA
jgi:hypothetical protein